jgi:hypothetical protein
MEKILNFAEIRISKIINYSTLIVGTIVYNIVNIGTYLLTLPCFTIMKQN